MNPSKKMTLDDLGAVKGMYTTDAKAEALMCFLQSYRAANPGMTPSYETMGNNIEVPEPAARILIARLAERGRISIISHSPLRIMLPTDPEGLKDHEGRTDEGSYGRYLSAEAARFGLGRFIAAKERIGEPISLRDMAGHVGMENLAYVSRMAEILCERGLIQYGNRLRTKLTKKGREFFGLKEEGTTAMASAAPTPAPVTVVYKSPTSIAAMVFPLCQALADHLRTSDRRVKYADLAEKLGYRTPSSGGNVHNIVKEAIRRGWLKPKKPHAFGIEFSTKGIAKFMPELVPPPFAPAEPIPDQHFDSLADFGEPSGPRPFAPREEVVYTASPRPEGIKLFDDQTLVFELIERGYTVRKG